jgi:hypothetical protein
MKESLGNQPAGGLGGNPVGGLKIMSGVTFPPLQIGTGVLFFFNICLLDCGRGPPPPRQLGKLGQDQAGRGLHTFGL